MNYVIYIKYKNNLVYIYIHTYIYIVYVYISSIFIFRYYKLCYDHLYIYVYEHFHNYIHEHIYECMLPTASAARTAELEHVRNKRFSQRCS